MGIDAEMFVRTKAKVTPDQARGWAVSAAQAFGHDRFWIFKREKTDLEKRHCMEIVREYTQDGPTIKPKKGETFIQVYPATRYYGPGYERGDLPFLIMLAEWLEETIPGAEVWYGGDSSGVEAVKFDWDARRTLFKHFCENAHRPYRGAFNGLRSSGKDAPKLPFCGFCGVPMNQYGFGKEYASYGCDGCGGGTETHDGGKTWTEKIDPEDWQMTQNRVVHKAIELAKKHGLTEFIKELEKELLIKPKPIKAPKFATPEPVGPKEIKDRHETSI